MRLNRTIVVYDGNPYCVYYISDHKPDGIFRVYLYPVDIEHLKDVDCTIPDVDQHIYQNGGDKSVAGKFLDDWLEKHPKTCFIRKQMNSPLFNKFRPFPIGMVNVNGGSVYYVARQPTRKTEQGLTQSSVDEARITLDNSSPYTKGGRGYVNMYTPQFADTIRGKYPTAQECLTNLLDPDIQNNAAAFHREFALVRGPIGLIFLAYRTDIVGVLPMSNFETVTVGRQFKHIREVTEALNLFGHIAFQN